MISLLSLRDGVVPPTANLEQIGEDIGLDVVAGTPRPIVDKIAAEVTRVVSDRGFRDKYIISRGQVPAINTPAEFAAEIKADRDAAKDVVKASGLEPQ